MTFFVKKRKRKKNRSRKKFGTFIIIDSINNAKLKEINIFEIESWIITNARFFFLLSFKKKEKKMDGILVK